MSYCSEIARQHMPAETCAKTYAFCSLVSSVSQSAGTFRLVFIITLLFKQAYIVVLFCHDLTLNLIAANRCLAAFKPVILKSVIATTFLKQASAASLSI